MNDKFAKSFQFVMDKKRTTLFISHANPSDNAFTRWLALKLTLLGYNVWCELLELNKGGDFWKKIETVIREDSCKFLIILSKVSNQSEGVAKELATAAKVKKNLQDPNFIIPILIDEELNYDDINIELVRLNSVDFKPSWAKGLYDLVEALIKQQVPCLAENAEKANIFYQQVQLQNSTVINQSEVYTSNWFPILSFPPELRFHRFGKMVPDDFDMKSLTFPGVRYKDYICTFGYEYDFIHQLPKTETYDNNKTLRLSVLEILRGEYRSEFISSAEAQRLIVQLTNKAFEIRMKEKGLNEYQMSNHLGFWFQKDQLEKDKFDKVQLVGKQKAKSWHFGISAAGKLYPSEVLMINSHIYFTEDGFKLIESTSLQHSSRRRQGKNWWNEVWRKKLLAFINYLADEENKFYLEVGSEEKIWVSTEPILFKSDVTYIIPDKTVLEEEVEIIDLNDNEGDFLEEE